MERRRRLRYGINLAFILFITLGFLSLLNYISTRHFFRLDLTEKGEFTISDSTKQVLRELDDIVNVNVYFSKKLPHHLIALPRQIKDLLEEYKVFSHGNLQFSFVDPSNDPKLEQRVRYLGIPQVQVNIIEKDKAQVVNIYLGLAVLYEDRKEVIPFIQDIRTFEYDLTSAILKVATREPKQVGFLSGHGEHDIYNGYNEIRKVLEKQYRVVKVELEENKEILVDTLIIAGPKEKLSESDLQKIDDFIMRGGRVIFLIDPIKRDEDTLIASKLSTGLEELLRHYGVKFKSALALDHSNAHASFRTGFALFTVPYPFWPKVIKQNFDAEHPIVSRLESVVFPWSAPLEIIKKEGVEAVELAKTTEHGWIEEEPFNLNPQQMFFRREKSEPKTLAIALSGKFKSAYGEKISEKTQLVIVGNSNFIFNNFLRQFRFNQIFFMNAVDWLTLGDKLIGIRSRGMIDRPLKEVTEREKALIRFANAFGVPFFVAMFGLLRFYLKRKTKKLLEVQFK